MISRRELVRVASALLAARVSNAEDPPKLDVIVRSARPQDFEMRPEWFGSWITPVERFFVRSHMWTPQVDLASWRLAVSGEVGSALSLSMGELRKLPAVEMIAVLECAGNGRRFFEPNVLGMPWAYGAVGNGRWRGVRLADVLRRAKVKTSANHILFNGADTPPGKMPDFQRSLPIAKAMHPDTLLAFDMNSEPLTLSHGFPLRVIAPGWAGDSWVKWVTEIRALDQEYDGFFMKTAYRYPVKPGAPGAPVDPGAMKPVESLKVKSAIAGPKDGSWFERGPVRFYGAAWSGESPVAKVEVSTDGGKSWQNARLGSERAKYAWRNWEMQWTPPGPGTYTLMSRATDAAGIAQPAEQEWNPSGYLWNVIPRTTVQVVGPGASRPAPPPAFTSRVEFPPNVRQACVGCHEAGMIEGQSLSRAQWEREVDKMIGWGAKVDPAGRSSIVDFLFQHFGRK